MKIHLQKLFILVLFSLPALAGDGRITILHTNDMHAQFVPTPATWLETTPLPQIGGMVALYDAIEQARKKYPNTLLLDAGDLATGTLLSKIEYNGLMNGGFLAMMNLIGYNAFTIGNHEFDDGQDNLRKTIASANFDVLSANLLLNGERFAPKAYEIYDVDGVSVGVIGLILTDLKQVTAPKNLDGITVADPVVTAQRYVDEIDPKTDVIVLLTHLGEDNDVALAAQVHNVDVIVGGHSHTRLEQARVENGVIIAQAGTKTRYLGRLTLDVADDAVANYDSELIPTWVDSVTSPNPAMVALVDRFQQQIDAEYGQQIGTLKTAWKNSNDYETNLGNFITDVLRQWAGTDVAFLNSGGIRKPLPAGPVTKMDVLEILPFANQLVTFECSGATLMKMLQNDINGVIKNSYGIMQLSGLRYTYKVAKDSSAIVTSMEVGGKKIAAKKIYTGVTVDFVMNNLKSHYDIRNIKTSPDLIADVVTEYIIKNPVIEARVEGRIQKIR